MQYRHNSYYIDFIETITSEESIVHKLKDKEKNYLEEAKKTYKDINPKEIEIVDIVYLGNDLYRIMCNILINE